MRFVHRRIEQRSLDTSVRAGSPMGSTAEKILEFPSMPVTKAALPGVSHFRATNHQYFLYIVAHHGGKGSNRRRSIRHGISANRRLGIAASASRKIT